MVAHKTLRQKSSLLVTLFLLASLSFSVFPALAQSTAPEDVARTLIAAEDSHNVDAAVASFADGAVVTLPTGVLDTPDAIRGWQQELADGHFRIEPIDLHADGNT